MDEHVVDNRQARRFEIYHGDDLAGFAEYHLRGNRIAVLHTEIVPRLKGRGLAGKLARHMLDDARRRRREVLPYCTFIRWWISEHPDYLDLVPHALRAGFHL